MKDSFRLDARPADAEINPALRYHVRKLYDIRLPETVDMDAIRALHADLARQLDQSPMTSNLCGETMAARDDGAQGRNRTSDTRIFSPLLYRLSYLGTREAVYKLARRGYTSFSRQCRAFRRAKMRSTAKKSSVLHSPMAQRVNASAVRLKAPLNGFRRWYF